MKKTGMFFLLALPALFLLAMVIPSEVGPQGKENRKTGDFVALGLGIDADLILEQGNTCSVDIQAEEKILEIIETEVKDGKLRIRYSRSMVPRHEKIMIRVTMKDVEELSVSGSGNITARGRLQAPELDLSVSGSGEIVLQDLVAEEVDGAISGSGEIKLAGSQTVKEMSVAISGSGKVDAQELPVAEFEGSISGSGNCYVQVENELIASISGSGNIYCTGNPRVDARVSGSGKVVTK